MEFKDIIKTMREKGLNNEANELEEQNKNLLISATKSGIAAILARNQSHNLGGYLNQIFQNK